LRGLAYEYGLVAPREIAALRQAVPAWLEDACNGLTVRLRTLAFWAVRGSAGAR